MDDELMERSDDSGELLDGSAHCIGIHRESQLGGVLVASVLPKVRVTCAYEIRAWREGPRRGWNRPESHSHPPLTPSHLDGLRQATPSALPAGVIHRPRRLECIIGIRVTQKIYNWCTTPSSQCCIQVHNAAAHPPGPNLRRPAFWP